VASDPVNFLDLTGLAWFRPDGHPYVVGYMDNNVPAMHSMGPIYSLSVLIEILRSLHELHGIDIPEYDHDKKICNVK
jgi:hypothetical protein